MRVRITPYVMMPFALVLAACSGSERDATGAPEGEPAPELAAGAQAPTDGDAVIGREIASLLPTEWVGAPVPFGTAEAPAATLLRFWTDSCPFCERSLPEIESLRERHGSRGLETIGIYHPKPARNVDPDIVRSDARRLGYSGPLALDPHWESLRGIWPERSGSSTSYSLLLDRRGVVRYVHPGPEFVGDELAELDQRIDALLSGSAGDEESP